MKKCRMFAILNYINIVIPIVVDQSTGSSNNDRKRDTGT